MVRFSIRSTNFATGLRFCVFDRVRDAIVDTFPTRAEAERRLGEILRQMPRAA